MAAIPELTANSEGTAGTLVVMPANGSLSGTQTDTPTYIADPYAGTTAAQFLTTAGTRIDRRDFPASSVLELKLAVKIATGPATTTGILAVYAGATKVCDLRTVGSTISLRDANTTVWTGTALAAGYHEIALRVGTQLRVKVYSGDQRGTSTATQTSGDQTRTVTGLLDNVRRGVLSAETMDLRLDVMRADNATEPASIVPPGGALTVTASADPAGPVEGLTTVTLTALTSGAAGAATFTYEQTAGTPVALSGTGATRTFTAPGVLAGTSLTWDVTATVGGATDTDTVTVQVLPHTLYRRMADGTLKPVLRVRSTAAPLPPVPSGAGSSTATSTAAAVIRGVPRVGGAATASTLAEGVATGVAPANPIPQAAGGATATSTGAATIRVVRLIAGTATSSSTSSGQAFPVITSSTVSGQMPAQYVQPGAGPDSQPPTGGGTGRFDTATFDTSTFG